MVVNRYLDKEAYSRLKAQDLIEERHMLRVRFIPGVAPDGWGFVGYENDLRKGKVVAKLIRGKFYIQTNAIYINEAFIRFVINRPFYKRGNDSVYRNYIVTHLPGEYEELVNFPISGRMGSIIHDTMMSHAIIPSNIHEYIFRVFRTGHIGKGIWNMELYLHDTSLPKIDDSLWGNGIIYERMTNNDISSMSIPQAEPISNNIFLNPDVMAAVQFVKDKILPVQLTRPTLESYIEWFTKYGGLSSEIAEQASLYRNQVRLP